MRKNNIEREAIVSHEYHMRTWYVETDQMGIIHHSNYIRYFEAARCDFMRSLGLSYAEVEARGIMMPILDVASHYVSPLYFDEDITIKVSLYEEPKVRIEFHYEVINSKGQVANYGTTTLGFMHSDTRRPTRVPEWFLEMITGKLIND
ncbi:MAG: thioesterase family protein [Rikenellaceae bacterium]